LYDTAELPGTTAVLTILVGKYSVLLYRLIALLPPQVCVLFPPQGMLQDVAASWVLVDASEFAQ
jgi:hypothetical protein